MRVVAEVFAIAVAAVEAGAVVAAASILPVELAAGPWLAVVVEQGVPAAVARSTPPVA